METHVGSMHGPAQDSRSALKIVVVIDMVGYSHMARLLEENAGAGAVAELNRQIQALVQTGLAALPAGTPYKTLAETGDGAIVLFNFAQDAHHFAEQVLIHANTHNETRSNKSAMRRFRIGIASGELTRMKLDESEENEGGYAGVTIANATRLESAAQPGEIVMDLATFEALSPDSRKCYSSESTVRGKRSEVFRVRKYRVVAVKALASRRFSRRSMLTLAAGATGTIALGSWFKFGNISRRLHPLPQKRFVALHSWPKPAADVAAIVSTLVASIEARLTRAEPRDKHFMVIVPNDPLFVASGSPLFGNEPSQLASSMGANLVLDANLRKIGERLNLNLRLLDPSSENVLRHEDLSTALTDIAGFSKFAAEAAANLLDLPPADGVLADEEELGGMNLEAYQLLADGKALVDKPNDVGLDQGIEKLQSLVNQYPRFAIGYAELSHAYLQKFLVGGSDPAMLELAKKNTQRALQLNPDSARAILSQAKIYVFLGQTDAALAQLDRAIKLDPMNPEVLLYKAATFRTLDRLSEEEAVYRQITESRPNYWVGYNELGGVLKREAKYPEAIQAYSIASQLAPKVSMPLTNLGILYIQTGDNARGSAAFERSIAIYPSDIAYIGLGDLAFEAANYKQAIADYTKAHELSPSDSSILRDLGDCYYMVHDQAKLKDSFEQAAALLTKQLQINPKEGTDWMTLSFYHAKVGRFEEAAKDIQTAEARGATDVESQLTKAQTVVLMGHKDEALQIVLKCMDRGLAPANVDLAVDLKDIRNDPRYKARVEHKS